MSIVKNIFPSFTATYLTERYTQWQNSNVLPEWYLTLLAQDAGVPERGCVEHCVETQTTFYWLIIIAIEIMNEVSSQSHLQQLADNS